MFLGLRSSMFLLKDTKLIMPKYQKIIDFAGGVVKITSSEYLMINVDGKNTYKTCRLCKN